MLRLTRKLFSRSVVANRCCIISSTSTRFERGTSTRRIGFSWSDSSRRSSIIGSFFARICAAICSRIFDGDTWCGKRRDDDVVLFAQVDRAGSGPSRRRSAYIACSSLRGVMISAGVG